MEVLRHYKGDLISTRLSKSGLSRSPLLLSLQEERDKVRSKNLNVYLRVFILEQIWSEAKHASDALSERVNDTIHVSYHVLVVRGLRLQHTHVLYSFRERGHLLNQDLNLEAVTVTMGGKQ